MTIEKAIEILKHCGAESVCIDYKYNNCRYCNQRIAQNMAIEALKEAIPITYIKHCQSRHIVFISELLDDWERKA